MYEPRKYRDKFSKERFNFFQLQNAETDLFIGIDKYSFSNDIIDFAKNCIIKYRKQVESYIKQNPGFQHTHHPFDFDLNAPIIIQNMIEASAKAGIGPMASVAGAFSQFIGEEICNTFSVNEMIIENGGDIFLSVKNDIIISVYAGNSPLSEKIAVKVLKGFSPIGICTSSGTVGHSFSYGKADAVMIACKNTLLADAYATAYANLVKEEKDIEKIIGLIKSKENIISAIIIKNDKFGICGNFELEVL